MLKKVMFYKIDMVLTDPPYGTTQCKWDTTIDFIPMWKELNRIVKRKVLSVFLEQNHFLAR